MTKPDSVQEPDPEFNTRCVQLLTDWDTQRIHVHELLRRFAVLAQEAAASGQPANQGRVEHILGYIHHYLGNYDTSNEHYEKARRFYHRANNRHRLAAIYLNQGENYRLCSDWQRALELYRISIDIVEDIGDLPTLSYALTNKGLTLIQLNLLSDARASLQRAYDLSLQWHGKVYFDTVEEAHSIRTEVMLGLAEIALKEKAFAEAFEAACEALTNADAADEPRSRGLAYRMLGNVLTYFAASNVTGIPTDPDSSYELSLAAFRQMEAQGEIGLTLSAYAHSLAARGDKQRAIYLYRQALVIFTRLGMTYDAARVADAQMKIL